MSAATSFDVANVLCKKAAKELADAKMEAFCAVHHPRLGQSSIFRGMDPGISQMIGAFCIQETAYDSFCEQSLPLFFSSRSPCYSKTSERVKRAIASCVLGDEKLLLARRLTLTEARYERCHESALFACCAYSECSWNRTVASSKNGTADSTKPFIGLDDVVMDIRSEWQAMNAARHAGGEFGSEDTSTHTVFFELHPSIVLPDKSMGHADKDFCRLEDCSDSGDSSDADNDNDDEGLTLYPAHIFTGGDCGVLEQGMDALGHIADIVRGQRMNLQLRCLLLSWIAELFVLQACVFPVSNATTKVGYAGEALDSCANAMSGQGRAIIFCMCHGYGGDGSRARCNFYVDLNVHRGGRLVSICFSHNDREEDDCDDCSCHWCMH